MRGMQGDNYLVNGTLDAVLDVANKAIRFRLLNASNARFYQLQFSDNRNFQQIATDSGLRETSAAMNSLILSPAERTEIVVDFSADLGQTLSLLDVNNNNKALLTITINQVATTTTIPTQLTTLNIPDANSAVRTRSFTLGMGGNNTFTINELSMDMARIDQTVPLIGKSRIPWVWLIIFIFMPRISIYWNAMAVLPILPPMNKATKTLYDSTLLIVSNLLFK